MRRNIFGRYSGGIGRFLVGLTMVWVLGATFVFAPPAHATDVSRTLNQSLSEIDLAVNHDEYVAGLGDLVFTITRTGDTSSELDLTFNITQEYGWLQTASFSVSMPAGESHSTLTLHSESFASGVRQEGDFTVAVDPVTGYDTSGATKTVRMVNGEGPAFTVSLQETEFRVSERAGALPVIVAAQSAPWVPYPVQFRVTLSARADEAASPVDYEALSEDVEFAPEDFREEHGTWVGRVTVYLTINDDDEYEGEERFELHIARTPGLSQRITLIDPDGNACHDKCSRAYAVRIVDDDEGPHFRISVSPERIDEAGGESTVRIFSANGKTFSGPRTFTLYFRGSATRGLDYTVSPADTNASADAYGHQVELPTGADSITLTVTATDDAVDDPSERIVVWAKLHENENVLSEARPIQILE